MYLQRGSVSFASCKNFKLCLLEKILKIVRAFLYFKTDFYTVVVYKATTFLSLSFQYYNVTTLKKKKLLLCNLGLSVTCFLMHVTNQLNKDVMGINFRQRFQEQCTTQYVLFLYMVCAEAYTEMKSVSVLGIKQNCHPTTVPHTLYYTHKALLDIWHN